MEINRLLMNSIYETFTVCNKKHYYAMQCLEMQNIFYIKKKNYTLIHFEPFNPQLVSCEFFYLSVFLRLHVQCCAACACLPAAEESSDHRGASWDQPPCFLCCASGRRHQSCQSPGSASRTGVHTTGQWLFKTPAITPSYGPQFTFSNSGY